MSTLAATNLKHASSASNNIVLDSSGNTTISGATTISGNAVVTGTLQANGVTGSVYPLVSGTAQASTSGTSIDFTGIPSWVKRVTVMFSNVSTNGTSEKLIQLIHSSGTVVTSGYRSAAARLNDTGLVETTSTAGFLLAVTNATDDLYGSYVFTNLSGNIWTGVGSTTYSFGLVTSCGGVTIASTLTGIRITTVNGTDAFDGGSINILYE